MVTSECNNVESIDTQDGIEGKARSAQTKSIDRRFTIVSAHGGFESRSGSLASMVETGMSEPLPAWPSHSLVSDLSGG